MNTCEAPYRLPEGFYERLESDMTRLTDSVGEFGHRGYSIGGILSV
jgi:hypothetical protein